MKLLFLALLLLPATLFADTLTTGNQKFLLPSTGVVDASRNWGDKINENFRITDSSLTSVQTAIAAIQTDTSTVLSLIKSTAVQVSNYVTENNSSTTSLRNDVNAIVTVNPYKIIVGTTGTTGINAIVNNANQFDLILNTVGARGTTSGVVGTNQSTVTAVIAFREGVYTGMQGSTIPAGIIAQGVSGSSTVWVVSATSGVIANVYGTLKGITFDLGNLGYAAPGIWVSSNGRIEDCIFTNGMLAQRELGDGSHWITIIRSSGAVVKNVVGYEANAFTKHFGSQVFISSSINSTVSGLDVKTTLPGVAGGNHVIIQNSTNTALEDSYFRNLTRRAWTLSYGSVNTIIRRNKHYILEAEAGGTGSVRVDAGPTNAVTSITTSTWITENEFYYYDGATGTTVMRLGSDGGAFVHGLIVERNLLVNHAGQTPTFFTLAFSEQTVFRSNATLSAAGGGMTMISDSGDQTKFSTLDNLRNNIAQ